MTDKQPLCQPTPTVFKIDIELKKKTLKGI